MTQKIDNVTPGVTAAAGRAKSAEAGAAAAPGVPVAKVAEGDSVKLTGDALYMSQLSSALKDVPANDDRRVERARTAIANGAYSVNPRTIASKLMRLEWEMGGRA
jgi:flagellar biosynthesis anti-sigma factor FlgM